MKKIIYTAALMAAAVLVASCDPNTPAARDERVNEISNTSYYVHDAKHKTCFLVYVSTGSYPNGNMAGAECTPEVLAAARPLIVR